MIKINNFEKKYKNLEKFENFLNNDNDFKKNYDKYFYVDEERAFGTISLKAYKKILSYRNKSVEEKINDDNFIEDCIKCLKAWGLQRGGYIVPFSDFKKQLQGQKDNLKKLLKEQEKYKLLEKLDIDNSKYIFEELFDSLCLKVNDKGKPLVSRFVIISKTLHFLLPDLIIPMSSYTESIISFQNENKPIENQLNSFLIILKIGQRILKSEEYKEKINNYIDNHKSNNNLILTKPKLIDNIIINYSNHIGYYK